MPETILILGASARAAAFSARRAGLVPIAVDRFADADLRACCRAIQVVDYPRGLLAAARQLPKSPWIYTGALENHPHLVDRIAAERPLLGNGGMTLRQIRNPVRVARALLCDGIAALEVRHGADAPTDGRWLHKPLRSGGGDRIHFAHVCDSQHNCRSRPRRWYWQRFATGIAHSAVYVIAAGRAILAGVSRQLTGTDWLGDGFRYAGSIGPIEPSNATRSTLEAIGNCLARRFELVGLVGVDFLLDGDQVRLVEVNPRYTASIEVLERGWSVNLLPWHIAACRDGTLPTHISSAPRRHCGKAIVYARRDALVHPALEELLLGGHGGQTWPAFADVPRDGTMIRQGQPILSVFADGESLDDVVNQLRELARRVVVEEDVGVPCRVGII